MNEVAPGRGEGEVPLTLKGPRDRFGSSRGRTPRRS